MEVRRAVQDAGFEPALAAELRGEDDQVRDEEVEVEPAIDPGGDRCGLDLVQAEGLVRVLAEEGLDAGVPDLAAVGLVRRDGDGDPRRPPFARNA